MDSRPENTDSNHEVKSNGGKQIYQAPRLTCFGSVRTFTHSGSGTIQEGAMVNPAKFPQTSDRTLKENIVRIGDHPLGIGLYLFDYLPEYRAAWGQGRQFGVMADEVEAILPEAVSVHADGYKVVDYGLLGVHRSLN